MVSVGGRAVTAGGAVVGGDVAGGVPGGGIGAWLFQWINIADYRAVGAAFIAIVVVIIALDFISARLRERII